MLRYAVEQVAHPLFYLMNGVPLIDSPLFFVWFFSIVLITSFCIRCIFNTRMIWFTLIFTITTLFISLILFIGVPLQQIQMLTDCKIETISENLYDINVNICRTKENYYGEYGSWNAVTAQIAEKLDKD